MKLQQMKNGQYTITVPQSLVLAFDWQKGTELDFKIAGPNALKLSKK